MITYSKLGRKGNLGNQLFQIASTVGMAEKYGHDYFFPKWDYAAFFKNYLPIFEMDDSFQVIKEKKFAYYEWNLGKQNYDLDGWLQSEKYFNKRSIRNIFEWGSFSDQLLLNYNFLFQIDFTWIFQFIITRNNYFLKYCNLIIIISIFLLIIK